MKETVIFNGSDYFTKEACDEAAEFLKETNQIESLKETLELFITKYNPKSRTGSITK